MGSPNYSPWYICVSALLISTGLYGQVITLDSQLTVVTKSIDGMYEKNLELETYDLALAALDRAMKEGKPKDIARAHHLLAEWHFVSVKSEVPDSFLRHDSLQLHQLLLTDDNAAIATAYENLGWHLVRSRRHRPAEAALLESIRRFRLEGDKGSAATVLINLSNIYRSLEDYPLAEKFLTETSILVEATDLRTQKIQLAKAWIMYYLATAQPQAALVEGEKMMNDFGQEILAESSLAYANMLAFRGSAYRGNGLLDPAMADFSDAWERLKVYVEHDHEADGWKPDIGTIHYLRGDYEKSIPFLSDGVSHLISKSADGKNLEQYLRYLSDAYAQEGRPDSAIHYLQLATKMHTERLEQRLASLRSELRVRYATEEKDQLISTQAGRIDVQTRNQRLSLGLIVLSLLGALGLFFGLRNNRRNNILLDARNTENETLLKEIHHRVKNNLEVISSLLELQSASLQDGNARDAMLASQSRVASMGLLHQRLYQGHNLATVSMRGYLTKLTESLASTYGLAKTIRFTVNVPEELELDVDTAIPVGLIVNELVTNSLKYAFGFGATAGAVTVELSRAGTDTVLSVSDNGAGKEDHIISGTGFGTRLVTMLTQQLEGNLREVNEGGLRTEVVF